VEKREKTAINGEESLYLKGSKAPAMPIVLLVVVLKRVLFLNYLENRAKKDGLTKHPVQEKATKEIISAYLPGTVAMAEKVTKVFWPNKTPKEPKIGHVAVKRFIAKNINRKYRLGFFIFAYL
jgi:hypothetical protein